MGQIRGETGILYARMVSCHEVSRELEITFFALPGCLPAKSESESESNWMNT